MLPTSMNKRVCYGNLIQAAWHSHRGKKDGLGIFLIYSLKFDYNKRYSLEAPAYDYSPHFFRLSNAPTEEELFCMKINALVHFHHFQFKFSILYCIEVGATLPLLDVAAIAHISP